jgi:membrane protein implicated in regulation of membrane protease activity
LNIRISKTLVIIKEMVNLAEYWESLNWLHRLFYFFAIPATVILILQSVGSILGLFGGEELDFDDADGEVDGDGVETDGLKFFSIRGALAFLAIFGWTGVVLADNNTSTVIALAISVFAGLLAMFAIAYFFYGISKLQSKGNVDNKNAIGKTAEVYLTIPPKGGGEGKVNVLIQERYVEVTAVTSGKKSIPTGSLVTVTGIDGNILIVKPHGED